MKIPETSANVAPYYANEENGQWQQNGVILDSGVGGGVVGSGDAGVRPVFQVQIPRGHIPGPYVMAGTYYPPGAYPQPQDDFEDYMWMENEEEFDKQVMQQLEEEALMEQCIEAMLEDEQREQRHRPNTNGHTRHASSSNGQSSISLEEAVSRSTLNPLAAEFVPNRVRSQPEDHQESGENKAKAESSKELTEQTEQVDSKEQIYSKQEEPQSTNPPEVSAAEKQPLEDTDKDKKKDTKKQEIKKNVKTDVKKMKQLTKANNKVLKKKEVKEDSVEIVKQSSPQSEDAQTAFKPVNYAAAAKASKPKKPTSPTMEQSVEKKPEKPEKKPLKEKPSIQRKNSAK